MSIASVSSGLVDRIGWLLFHSLWQFALIALVILFLLRSMRRAPANVRYGTCLVGWVGMVIAPAVTCMFLQADARQEEVVALRRPVEIGSAPRDLARSASVELAPTFPAADPLTNAVDPVAGTAPAEFVGTRWVSLEERITPWLEEFVALWCLGVLLFGLRPVWGWYTVEQLRRSGVSPVPSTVTTALKRACDRLGMRQKVRVLQSTLVNVPLVGGYVRPLILLPVYAVSGLSASQVEAIFLHELAHVRRHDYLVNLMQTLAETIFFYHPAVWWLSSRIRDEREHCCDDKAVAVLGSRTDYCSALLALEELRGRTPVLSLGANDGSLLERIRRLAGSESGPRVDAGGLLSSALVALLLIGIGVWTATQAYGTQAAVAQETSAPTPDGTEGDKALPRERPGPVETPSRQGENAERTAKELAVRAHAKAAAIDKLPRFYIRAHGRSKTDDYLIENPRDQDPLENLLRALDPEIADEDWYRYEGLFAWDEEHFVLGSPATPTAAPDRFETKDEHGNPAFRWVKWGMRSLSAERNRNSNGSARHVLRANATAGWKTEGLSNPNYVLATHHEFWWGANAHPRQHFGSGVPPSHSIYRDLGAEEFDGEFCDVVESPTRFERLWISRETGLIRGYAHLVVNDQVRDLYKSERVQEIAGRSFATQRELQRWYRTEQDRLPAEKKWALSKVWSDSLDWGKARVTLVVRFRDFREIAPGVWWPFREDRTQGRLTDEGLDCLLSNYTVHRIRTDFDLSEAVSAFLPKEGERVQDQRYAVPVDYEYRADRTEAEILKLVDAEYQERLKGQEVLKRLTEPIENMVGQSAPALPADGWIGGSRPELAGKPYLIHLWAAWCGPCKNDFPILKRMADRGALVVGLHPADTPVEEVEEVREEFKLGYPTFLASDGESRPTGRTIAGYPADLFPYCILVDAQGKVAGHGTLRSNDMELLHKFRELRDKSDTN